jgi:hypothetical protein
LSDSFPNQRGLKQGDALSPLLFNFALEDAIRKVQQKQVRLKLNGTHHLLAYADDVNLLGDNIDTANKNTEILIDASKEVSLEVNVKKIKYVLSRDQNAGRIPDIKIEDRLFEIVPRFKYFGTILKNKNLLHVKIKRTLISCSACHHSFHNLLSFRFLSKITRLEYTKL